MWLTSPMINSICTCPPVPQDFHQQQSLQPMTDQAFLSPGKACKARLERVRMLVAIFGHTAGSYGILYEGFYKESGWMLDRKRSGSLPAVRGVPSPRTEEAPGQRRNRQRAQRRYLELARVLSQEPAEAVISHGRYHMTWRNSEAEQNIMQAATSCGRKLCNIVVEGCFY